MRFSTLIMTTTMAAGEMFVTTEQSSYATCDCGPGGSLACIRSSAQNDKALALLKARGTSRAWIGAYQWPVDEGAATGWKVCSSGKSISYTNWAQGEPGGGSGVMTLGCAALQDDGSWGDFPCYWSQTVPCLCEKGAPPSPAFVALKDAIDTQRWTSKGWAAAPVNYLLLAGVALLGCIYPLAIKRGARGNVFALGWAMLVLGLFPFFFDVATSIDRAPVVVFAGLSEQAQLALLSLFPPALLTWLLMLRPADELALTVVSYVLPAVLLPLGGSVAYVSFVIVQANGMETAGDVANLLWLMGLALAFAASALLIIGDVAAKPSPVRLLNALWSRVRLAYVGGGGVTVAWVVAMNLVGDSIGDAALPLFVFGALMLFCGVASTGENRVAMRKKLGGEDGNDATVLCYVMFNDATLTMK